MLKGWDILATHKGANIYGSGDFIVVCYQKHNGKELKWCKSVTSAKRWITSNKSYFVSTVTRSNGSQYQLFKDTIFY